jgi:hypothetical protein
MHVSSLPWRPLCCAYHTQLPRCWLRPPHTHLQTRQGPVPPPLCTRHVHPRRQQQQQKQQQQQRQQQRCGVSATADRHTHYQAAEVQQ